jgi:hypothetical protein
MTTALDWWTFAQDAPGLARIGWPLLQAGQAGQIGQNGKEGKEGGSVLLATTRSDAGPRLQPCSPVLDDGRLYLLLEEGTAAVRDLRREARYGIRARGPLGRQGEVGGVGHELRIEGTALPRTDPVLLERIATQAGLDPVRVDALFELLVEQVGVRRRLAGAEAQEMRWRCLGRRACA